MRRSNSSGSIPGYQPSRLGPILILTLTCGSLASIAAVWWYYIIQSGETKAAASRQLFSVVQGKSEQIANWRHERIGDARLILSSMVMRVFRRALSTGAPSGADRSDLLDLMSHLAGQFLYSDVTLVDVDGNVVLRLREESTEGAEFRKKSRGAMAREAIIAHDVVLSDLRPDTRTGRPLMALTTPIDDGGALILDIDPARFLYPSLETWPGSSRTGEITLVRLEGNDLVTLSARRNDPQSALFSRRHINTIPPDSVLDAGWSLETRDYRGIPAFGTIRRVAGSPWFLICKMDLAEVEAPLQRLGWEMALVTALIALANAAGVWAIWRGQQSRIHHEREAWFYAIANDTPAYLWMASAGDGNSFINQPLRRFLGTDQQQLSNTWTQFIHPEDVDRAQSKFVEGLAAGRGYTEEFRIRRFDGAWRWVIAEAVPRYAPEGRFLGFAGALLDNTDRRNAEDQLRRANATLVVQLEEEIHKEKEIEELGARLIGAQEEERKRLARELHDDLNQQIAAASLAMSNLKRQIPAESPEARSQSEQIRQRLVDIAESVRRMSHELHPAILRYSGLAAALQTYCEEFGSLTRIQVSLEVRGAFDDVSSAAALCVYRVAQEALRNVAKHAKVQAAEVALHHADGQLTLTIADRGVGMEVELTNADAGLGLVSMRERARLARGTLEIQSQPNQGTTITLRIPP